MALKGGLKRALVSWKGHPADGLLADPGLGSGVPRIIHQVLFAADAGGAATPPAEIVANIERLRDLNPDWEYRLHDGPAIRGFIERHYGSAVLDYFLRINPAYGAARADLFRYLLLYRLGGVYLDIKSVATRPLSEVVRPTDRYLLAQWRNGAGEEHEGFGLHPELRGVAGGEFQQWHIIAAAGHPFLRAVLQRVLDNLHRYNAVLHGTGLLGVLRTTGPIPYTQAIQPLLGAHPHRRVDAERDLGLQFSLYRHTSRHHGLFGPHYSLLTEPIARQGAADQLLSGVLRQANRLRPGQVA